MFDQHGGDGQQNYLNDCFHQSRIFSLDHDAFTTCNSYVGNWIEKECGITAEPITVNAWSTYGIFECNASVLGGPFVLTQQIHKVLSRFKF